MRKLQITLIALCGGILGVLFMVPLRNALIVKEHATLLYPEGTACADVLLAGEEGGANASTVFSGMGLAAIFKFLVDGLKMIPADIAVASVPSRVLWAWKCTPLCWAWATSSAPRPLPTCSPVLWWAGWSLSR